MSQSHRQIVADSEGTVVLGPGEIEDHVLLLRSEDGEKIAVEMDNVTFEKVRGEVEATSRSQQ